MASAVFPVAVTSSLNASAITATAANTTSSGSTETRAPESTESTESTESRHKMATTPVSTITLSYCCEWYVIYYLSPDVRLFFSFYACF